MPHHDPLQTPYMQAKQEWDNRIGASRVQARNWRLVAIIALLLAFVLAVFLGMSVNMQTTKVFVAQVGSSGQVINVAPLEETYQPNQAQVEYFVTNFIKDLRSIPLDPVVAKQNWLTAYQYLTEDGATQLNTLMQQNNPTSELGKQTVTVDINDVNPLSPNTLQVDWTETTVDVHGKPLSTIEYSGVFNTIIQPPKTQAEILNNPLGIFITHFNLSERNH